jgi:hypothetical protein
MGAAAKKFKKKLPESTTVQGTVHFMNTDGQVRSFSSDKLRIISFSIIDWRPSEVGEGFATVTLFVEKLFICRFKVLLPHISLWGRLIESSLAFHGQN